MNLFISTVYYVIVNPFVIRIVPQEGCLHMHVVNKGVIKMLSCFRSVVI